MSSIARSPGGGAGRDSARWGISFAIVCALHIAVVAAFWTSRIGQVSNEVPPDAVLIDLAPQPKPMVAPAEPSPPTPPVPQRELPKIETPPPPHAVILPKPAPPKPTPPRLERVEKPPAPQPIAPSVKATATPLPQLSSILPNPMPIWEREILARLERFKRYPRAAILSQQEGTVYIRLRVARNGDLVSYALQRSSGIESLDEATLALIERAKPFPPAPGDIGRDTLELVIPVHFTLR